MKSRLRLKYIMLDNLGEKVVYYNRDSVFYIDDYASEDRVDARWVDGWNRYRYISTGPKVLEHTDNKNWTATKVCIWNFFSRFRFL